MWFRRKQKPSADTEKMRLLASGICGASFRGEYDGDFYRDIKSFLRTAADELDQRRAGETPEGK